MRSASIPDIVSSPIITLHDIFDKFSDEMSEAVPMVMQHIPGSWFAVEIKALSIDNSKGTQAIVSSSYAEKWLNNEMIFRFDKNPTKSHTVLKINEDEKYSLWDIWNKYMKISKRSIKPGNLNFKKTCPWSRVFGIDNMVLAAGNKYVFQYIVEWILSQDAMNMYGSETSDEKQDEKEDVTIHLSEINIPDPKNSDSPLGRLHKIFSLNRRLFNSRGIGLGSSLLIGLDIGGSNDDIKDGIQVDYATLTAEHCLDPHDKIRLSIDSCNSVPTKKDRDFYDDLDLEIDHKRVITNKMGQIKGDAAIAIAKQLWTSEEEEGLVIFVFLSVYHLVYFSFVLLYSQRNL